MLRELFHQLFPLDKPQDILAYSEVVKQQIIAAKVRLIILKDTNFEEKYFIVARLAALQAKYEELLFFYLIAIENDEEWQYRNWVEKQDTTYGPLYSRTFKRRQSQQNYRSSPLYSENNQQHLAIPSRLQKSIFHVKIFFDGVQNQPVSYKFADEAQCINFLSQSSIINRQWFIHKLLITNH